MRYVAVGPNTNLQVRPLSAPSSVKYQVVLIRETNEVPRRSNDIHSDVWS